MSFNGVNTRPAALQPPTATQILIASLQSTVFKTIASLQSKVLKKFCCPIYSLQFKAGQQSAPLAGCLLVAQGVLSSECRVVQVTQAVARGFCLLFKLAYVATRQTLGHVCYIAYMLQLQVAKLVCGLQCWHCRLVTSWSLATAFQGHATAVLGCRCGVGPRLVCLD